jgi:hypothetical protein
MKIPALLAIRPMSSTLADTRIASRTWPLFTGLMRVIV